MLDEHCVDQAAVLLSLVREFGPCLGHGEQFEFCGGIVRVAGKANAGQRTLAIQVRTHGRLCQSPNAKNVLLRCGKIRAICWYFGRINLNSSNGYGATLLIMAEQINAELLRARLVRFHKADSRRVTAIGSHDKRGPISG
jgi:hypothetical protein